MAEKILRTEYSEEMQKSYLDYSMSVITGRAVPDIRDGLKPVQRRLLYDMSDLRVSHDKKEMKSARITGDCMGRFHPHGDSSIYETMVVMSQDFKRSVPLVDGKGNFGSIEGDPAAAYRYTEAKLKEFTDEVFLKDIDKSVPFVPAYTNTESEPEVLPVRIPNFLLNGSEGIAVGMTTQTPCHNLTELCELCIAYTLNPEMTTDEMLSIMPGPDFPTGGIIANRSELKAIYESGTGRLKLRGRVEYVPGEKKGEKDKLVVTQIPYTMIGSGIAKFMQDVAMLAESKKLPEVTDIGNASDAEGINIFIEIKKGSDVERIINILYQKTRLEDTFGVNMLAISEGRPEVLSLRGVLEAWHKFQHDIIERKYRALLEKAEEKKEIEEGLIAASHIIDLVIAVIRGSKNRKDAENCLMHGDISRIALKSENMREDAAGLRFSARQTKAILEMPLYRLIGLELDQLQKSYRAELRAIREYKAILSDPHKRDELICEDLKNIAKKYGYPRRSELSDSETVRVPDEPAAVLECVFMMDRFGYCKMVDKTAYLKARTAASPEPGGEESEAGGMEVSAMSDGRILIFTDSGNLHTLRCQDVPMRKLKDKGVPLDNISRFDNDSERVVAVFARDDGEDANFIFVTAGGLIKRVDKAEFETANKLVAATRLAGDDRVVNVIRTTEIGLLTFAIWTRKGYALRFALDDVPLLKKMSQGVRGIRLKAGDEVTGAAIVTPASEVTFGEKTVILSNLRTALRGGTGTKQRK